MSELLNRVLSYSFYVSAILSIFLTLNFASWSVSTRAFDEGYTVAEREFRQDLPGPKFKITHEGEGTYKMLSRVYWTLALGALGLLLLSGLQGIVKNLGLYRLLGTAGIVLLLLILWEMNWLLLLKDPNWNESLDSDFNSLVRESVAYDRVSGLILILLLGIQIACFAITFRREARAFRFGEGHQNIY